MLLHAGPDYFVGVGEKISTEDGAASTIACVACDIPSVISIALIAVITKLHSRPSVLNCACCFGVLCFTLYSSSSFAS